MTLISRTISSGGEITGRTNPHYRRECGRDRSLPSSNIPAYQHGLRKTNLLQAILGEKDELYCIIHDPDEKMPKCSCIDNFYTAGYTDEDAHLFPQYITKKTKKTAIAEKRSVKVPLSDKQRSLEATGAIPNTLQSEQRPEESEISKNLHDLLREHTNLFYEVQNLMEEEGEFSLKVGNKRVELTLLSNQIRMAQEELQRQEDIRLNNWVEMKRKFEMKDPIKKWADETEEVKEGYLPYFYNGIFRPPVNPNYKEGVEGAVLRGVIPASIAALSNSGYREMEQLSYRFIQEKPDENGYRTVYVWFNVLDNGTINHMQTTEGEINYEYIKLSGRYMTAYARLFKNFTGNDVYTEWFNQRSSEIADDVGNTLMPPEYEWGPHEYKNSPYVIKENTRKFMQSIEEVDLSLTKLIGNEVYDTQKWKQEYEQIVDLTEIESIQSEIEKISKSIEDCLDTIELISDSRIHRWTNKDVNKLDPTGQLNKSKGGLYFGFKQEPEEEGVSPNTTRFIRDYEWDDITIGFKFELEDLNDERIKLEKKLATIKPKQMPPYDESREYWKRFSVIERDGRRQFSKQIPYVIKMSFSIYAPGYSTNNTQTWGNEINSYVDENNSPNIELYSHYIDRHIHSPMYKVSRSYPKNRQTLQRLHGHIKGLVDFKVEQQRTRIECQRIIKECTDSIVTAALMARQPIGVKVKGEIVNNFRTLDLTHEDDRACYDYIISFLREVAEGFNNLKELGWQPEDVSNFSDALIANCKTTASQMRVAWQRGKMTKQSKISQYRLRKISITDLFSWQSIDPEVEMSSLSQRTFKFCSKLNPISMTDLTTVSIDGKVYQCTTFTLGQMGYLGRSLPRPTERYLLKQSEETFQRFKSPKMPHDMDNKMKEYTFNWAKEYFQREKMKQTDGDFKERSNATVSASFERTRSKGGFIGLISELYKLMSNLPISDLLEWPKSKEHFERYKDLHDDPLISGNIKMKGQVNQEYIYAVSLDFMKEYIDHAEVCKRENCDNIELHLPMWINAIPELGGKARIPCYSSGFINALAEPVRKKMYNIITQDSRTSFRLRHGDKISKLKGFLKKFAEEPVTHSGDLTVSTDNFPMWFTEQVIKGMFSSGYITQEERNIALCATGPYRCIHPNEYNEKEFRQSQPETLQSIHLDAFIRDTLEWNRETNFALPSIRVITREEIPIGFIKERLVRSSGPKSFSQMMGEGDKGRDYRTSQGTREYQSTDDGNIEWPNPPMKTPNWDRMTEEEKDNYGWINNPGLYKREITEIMNSAKTQKEYLPEVENFLKGRAYPKEKLIRLLMSDAWFRQQIASNLSDWENFLKEGKIKEESIPYTDPKLLLLNLTTQIKFCLSPYQCEEAPDGSLIKDKIIIGNLKYTGLLWESPYLTKKGVQMASSISIAMLYSYNLVADTWARDKCNFPHFNCKGALSQLCGDDCLRAGSQDFIDAYKLAIVVLGGVFSKTKDVVGRQPRGVFTEFMFEGEEFLPITKVKTLVRNDLHDAPAWKRSIQAILSINSRGVDSKVLWKKKGLSREKTYGQDKSYVKILQEELIRKYQELNRKDSLVNLPTEFGGIGHLGKTNDTIEKILVNIRRIKSPFVATKAIKLLRRPITVDQRVERKKNLDPEELLRLTPNLLTDTDGRTSKIRQRMYEEGKVIWLKDISQGLRGKIEIASMLDNPPQNKEFGGGRFQIMKEKEAIDECYTYLKSKGVADFAGNLRSNQLRDTPLRQDLFLGATLYADVPTEFLRDIEGPDLEYYSRNQEWAGIMDI